MTTDQNGALFADLETFYDAVPRQQASHETHGGLVLFVKREGFPYYARPVLGATPTRADLDAVRARQRELGMPEAFEWVHQNTPGLLDLAEAAGLAVLRAPLMVCEPDRLPDGLPDEVVVRMLDAADPNVLDDLAQLFAVTGIAFGNPGTATGSAGTAERDEAVPSGRKPAAEDVDLIAKGLRSHAIAETTGDGVLGGGTTQRAGDVVEVVGVGTLPAARRRGLGAAVTAALARHAYDSGARIVFLGAGSEEIARVYASVGFRRIGTACIAEPA
jgi:GNAT superfamily N-acetyltransferase